MSKTELNCLRDCDATCCWHPTMSYDFRYEEVIRLNAMGSDIRPLETRKRQSTYEMRHCGALDGNKCMLHGTSDQPDCCQKFIPGSFKCTWVRAKARE